MHKLVYLASVASIIWMAPAAPALSDEILDISRAVAAAGHPVPSARTLREACDADSLCVARFLKDRLGDGAEIIPVEENSSEPKRWRTAAPPLKRVIEDGKGRLIIVLAQFDAKAIAEAVNTAAFPVRKIVLDIREIEKNADLDGMRRVAALFIGKAERAFQVRHSAGKDVDWTIVKPPQRISADAVEVWVDQSTDAVGEVFAALLRSLADAQVLGQTTKAKGYLKNIVPVTRGWALAVPTARIFMKGIDFNDGLIPDGSIPE